MGRLVFSSLIVLAAAAVLGAQDINTAKELYAAAAYEEALAALQPLSTAAEPDIARQANQYRAFCLMALGKTSEAELAAEAAIRRDPFALIDTRDLSPRIDALFTAVRKRVLPSVIRDAFRSARERMNEGGPASAQVEFANVKRMLNSAASLGVKDPALADLSELVDGFMALGRAAEEPPTASTGPGPTPPAGASAPASEAAALPRGTEAVKTPSDAEPRNAPPRRAIYGAADSDVLAPAAIVQDVPVVKLESAAREFRRSGIIEVLIDDQGIVKAATMRETISPLVDRQLLDAARGWRYRPAMLGGVPVPYVKSVTIAIER